MKSPNCLWAVVSDECPWTEWWPDLSRSQKWPQDVLVEKYSGTEVSWAQLSDSAKNFSLFSKYKILVVTDAEKAFRGERDPQKILENLSHSPHRIVFQSTTAPLKGLQIEVWQAKTPQRADMGDDKVAFRWIDFIHKTNLSEALKALEIALATDQHPLVLAQLVSRDFRLGRLIQHALEQRLREDEIVNSLRINPFAIKKWAVRKAYKKTQWLEIFDRLQRVDLELKSGTDEAWALRKLTFDLVQILSSANRAVSLKRSKITSAQIEPLLWQVVPSFA